MTGEAENALWTLPRRSPNITFTLNSNVQVGISDSKPPCRFLVWSSQLSSIASLHNWPPCGVQACFVSRVSLHCPQHFIDGFFFILNLNGHQVMQNFRHFHATKAWRIVTCSLKEMGKERKTTPMLPPTWIMVLPHFRVGVSVSLYVIPKQALRELEAPQRLLPPFKVNTLNGHEQSGRDLSLPRASS